MGGGGSAVASAVPLYTNILLSLGASGKRHLIIVEVQYDYGINKIAEVNYVIHFSQEK